MSHPAPVDHDGQPVGGSETTVNPEAADPGVRTAADASSLHPDDADTMAIENDLDGRRADEAMLGIVRLGVGAALVAAPRWAGRLWVGPGADGPGSLVFARALGARDVALGLRILQGWRRREPVGHWIVAGFAADGADVAATMIASRHLTPVRRWVLPGVAAAVGVAGLVTDRRT